MRYRWRMKRLAFAALLVLAGPVAAQAPVWGVGKAKDGDSLMADDTEVRLFGIDAPELDQSCKKDGQDWSCGSAAADQLSRLVTGKQVRCDSVGKDQHGRTLGRCMVGMTDINRTMVAMGYAVAYRRYSSDYVSAEESAKVNKRGLWAGTFQMPSDYRHAGDAPVPHARRLRESARHRKPCPATGQAEHQQLQHQRQSEPQGPVDLPRAGHALLRPDEARRDLLHRGRSSGCGLSEGDCE